MLDASVVLAYLQREPGFEQARAALGRGGVISAVNAAEVYGKAAEQGFDVDGIAIRLAALGLETFPFSEPDARATAALQATTRPYGLSLGDRACLALGQRLGATVLTADRVWTQIETGLTVTAIR